MNFDAMKDLMDRFCAWIVPGNQISVWKEGKEIFSYTSGYSDLENKIPMRPDHLVNIYSCSKPATVTAALQLMERGYFLLSDPVSKFLPAFANVTVRDSDGTVRPAKTPVTMRHLFTMTAGLTYNHGEEYMARVAKQTDGKFNTVTAVSELASDPLTFDPGAHWQYSLCHDVLAGVVEVISGMKFRDYVQKNIFDPLEMATATYHNEAIRDKMAEQYFYDNGNKSIVDLQSGLIPTDGGYIKNVGKGNDLIFGTEYDSGGAGITVSVRDYAKFGDALANGGVGYNGNRILSAGSVELLRTNQLNATQLKDFNWTQLLGYGYGLGVRTMMDRAVCGSNGSVGEFGWGGAAGATLLVDPDRHVSFFYALHMLNPQEDYYQPRLRNVFYKCLDD